MKMSVKLLRDTIHLSVILLNYRKLFGDDNTYDNATISLFIITTTHMYVTFFIIVKREGGGRHPLYNTSLLLTKYFSLLETLTCR